MRIVIDIPESKLWSLKNEPIKENFNIYELASYIDKGTPLKTGHWVEKDGYDGDTYYDCSVCGESWTTIDGTPWDNGMSYCPNCGARMESEE